MLYSDRPVANVIRIFWCNLHPYWHIALSFDSGYAAKIYAVKRVKTLNFFAYIYLLYL